MKKYKNTLFYFFGAPFLIVAGLLMFAPSAQAAVISMQPTEMISAGQKAQVPIFRLLNSLSRLLTGLTAFPA